MSFALSMSASPPIAFLLRRSQLKGRLDPEYNFALLNTKISSKYPLLKIRDIATSRTGGTPSKSRPEYWEGSIPWASPKDFISFHLSDTEDHISEDAVSESATSVVPPRTLLIVFRSGILQHSLPVTITTTETAINQDLKALIFGEGISAEYVGAFFVVFGQRLLPLIIKSGATVQSINTEQFDQLEIPVPPSKVQKTVVDTLLNAFRSKQEKESRAKTLLGRIDRLLLDELGIGEYKEPKDKIETRIFRSNLEQVTGQRWDPLFHQGDVFRFIKESRYPLQPLGSLVMYFMSGFAAGRNEQGEEKDGVIQIRPTNISDDRELVFHRNIYIASSELATRPLDILKRREVLFNNTNSQEQVGKTAHFDLAGKYCCSNHITRILTDQNELEPRFLKHLLNLYQRKRAFFKLCTNWNNQSGVGADVLGRLPVPTPDLKRQKQIVDRLEKVRTEAHELRRNAERDLEVAKTSIESTILRGGADT